MDRKIEGRQKPKTINIFDILITENGITIADKKPIDKFEDIKPKLPLDKIQFNKPLIYKNFLIRLKIYLIMVIQYNCHTLSLQRTNL